MRPCSRMLAARHLLRGSRFQLPTATAAASVLRRPDGTNGPPVPMPHLGGFGPSCRVYPGRRAPFGRLHCLLPCSTYPPRWCAWPRRDLRGNAFSTSANAVTAGKPVDDNVHKDAPKKDIDDQIADIQILQNLWKYLRLNNSRDFNIRIVLSLGLLVGAKPLVVLKLHWHHLQMLMQPCWLSLQAQQQFLLDMVLHGQEYQPVQNYAMLYFLK